MADQLLPTVSNMAVEKPQPLQVEMPSSMRIASLNPVGDGSRYTQAANNSRESAALVNAVHNENLRAVASFSSSAQEKLGQMQNDAFADGYLKTMQGKSLEDIQKDQGFMDKLFGDGGAVRGARAAQVSVAGDSMVSWLQQNQGDLARLPLDAQRKALADQMESLKTGDPEQDQLIVNRMTQVFPTVMEGLARTTHVENQRKASIAQADTLASKSNNLQYISQEVAKGNMSSARYDEAMKDYMEFAEPLPGQTPASWRNLMQSSVSDMVGKGQFEAANTLKERVSRDLTPDERMQLDASTERQQKQWLLNNPMSRDYTEFKVGLPQQIMAGRFSSPEQIDSAIDAANKDHSATTHSLSPLVDNEERVHMQAYYQRYMDAQSKQQGKADMEALYLHGYAVGSPETMKAATLDTDRKAVIDNQVALQFQNDTTGGAADMIGRLASVGVTNGFIKEPLDRTVGLLKGGGVPSQEALSNLQATYSKLSKSQYGMGAAEAYLGTDGLKLAHDMEAMDMTNPANLRYMQDRAVQMGKQTALPAPMLKQATAVVSDQFEGGWMARTFGSRVALGEGVKAELQGQMVQATASVMAEYPNFSQESILSMATSRVRQNTTLLGDRLVSGPGSRDLFATISKATDIPVQSPEDPRFNAALDAAWRSRVPDHDYALGNVFAYPNGMMRLAVTAPDGTFRDIVMPASAIADQLNKHGAKKESASRSLNNETDDSKPKHLVELPSGKKMWVND